MRKFVTNVELKEKVVNFFKGSKVKPARIVVGGEYVRVLANILNKDVDKFEGSKFLGIELKFDESGNLENCNNALVNNKKIVSRFVNFGVAIPGGDVPTGWWSGKNLD